MFPFRRRFSEFPQTVKTGEGAASPITQYFRYWGNQQFLRSGLNPSSFSKKKTRLIFCEIRRVSGCGDRI